MLQVLQPIAIGILSECEEMAGAAGEDRTCRKVGSFFGNEAAAEVGGDIPVDARILDYLKETGVAHGLEDFRIADFEIADRPAGRRGMRAVDLRQRVRQYCEAINHLDVDVVLLTGRPTRLPQVISLFQNKLAVPLDRIVPIRDYRVGTWYPFRGVSNTHIDDPKTTAVVGAMLCALSERQITNFTLYSNMLRMRSTARYIGLLQNNDDAARREAAFSRRRPRQRRAAADEEAEFDYHSPVRIGFRQLPLERWVATPLYKLTSCLHASLEINPASRQRDDRAQHRRCRRGRERRGGLLSSEATREEFVIQDAEDADGAPVKRMMELKLDTLAVETGDGYWLDTGILSIQ